ncbi:MAG TPA: PSD1 and planctomycete cytochrome C domain-containing protein [Bryobacteraceae bacterium]|nr:PSD1 and planctomycete cytochrome C domain-containing protein [Bryobacteraceae bacterium]
MKAILLLLPAWAAAAAPPDSSRAIAILEQRCFQCHGDKVAMANLKLLTRDQVLKGGARGPALQPGKPEASLLMDAVLHKGKLAMPPNGKLPPEEIEILRAWISGGAVWPATPAYQTQKDWWSFRKPLRPAVPSTAKHPVDAFIVERIHEAKLPAVPEASKLALVKRAYYDLHGLPPTHDQAQAYIQDAAPGAWDRLIDTLLASPRYGEKWGRHWLDLVRYGDTAGFEQDPYILDSWRYRDYVIKSFNDDKPYDKFAREQMAADELYPDDPDARTGTGYFRVNANRDMLFKVEEQNIVERLTDFVDTTSTVFLGLTVGCARCHDHKFDPIPQRDFYRMQAIFAPIVNDRAFLDYNPARNYDLAANSREFRLRQMGQTIERIQNPYRQKLREAKIAKLAPDVQTVVAIEAGKRTPEQQSIATQAEAKIKVSDDEIRAELTQADAERLHSIEKRLVSMFAGYAPPPMAPAVIDVGREAPRTYLAIRGNPENHGEEVQPGFLSALGGGDVPEPPLRAKSTGRRKALANWMASAENPLFARVMVNRVWQYHFGEALLRTPSDWGTRAGQPSHPELLDWLAAEFIERKWSLKSLHRLLMTSQAYKRSADAPPAARERDPGNLLLTHMNRRRLQWEEIRDAALLAGGRLNLKMGGTPVVPPLESEELFGIIGRPENAWAVSPDPEDHLRRSVYLLSRRTFRPPMFEAFDAPEGIASCSRRNESTTAPQSLSLLNSRFMMEQARELAAKATTVEDVWRRALSRDPSLQEKSKALTFLERQSKQLGSPDAARVELARALLNLNEFLYVD